MLLVIFGAGASYDSAPDFPLPETTYTPRGGSWRPPLTNQLFLDSSEQFGSIVPKYPKLASIIPFLRRPQNGRTLEQQLEFYLDESSADQERKRQLLSVRYYIHDLLRIVSTEWLKRTNGVTNYAVLLDQIRHRNTANEPVYLVTFNYDLLLDRAVLPLGTSPQPHEPAFDVHPMFKLFKPHGSVDWARLVTGPITQRQAPQQLIEQAPDLRFSDQYVRANATDPNEMFKFNGSIIPAIAIPVQTKTEETFEWPIAHQLQFEQVLPHVTKTLIVGWQAKEAHFLKLLREKLPKGGVTQITHLQVVAKDSADAGHISKQFIADIDRRVQKLDPSQGSFCKYVEQDWVSFFDY